jgi:glucose 1-dehydrogenase
MTSPSTPLAGQAALITGGSRGIGRAAAIALAQAGADVAINYFSHDDEARAVAEEVRRTGRRALPLKADVADQEAVERLVERTVAEFGRLDVAVSNAYYSDRALFYEADMAGFRRTVDVTMWGAFHTLRAAARHMIGQRRGSIVLISSPRAFLPMPMAKAAVDQMARTAAIELAKHRVRINVIHPGWIDTPGERKFTTDEQMARAAENIPWQRLGQPEEIARAVVFLSDPASDYVTGAELLIDGGITLPWWGRGPEDRGQRTEDRGQRTEDRINSTDDVID